MDNSTSLLCHVIAAPQSNVYLGHGYVIASPVKYGRVVVDVLDLDGDGAHILQGRSSPIARLKNNLYTLQLEEDSLSFPRLLRLVHIVSPVALTWKTPFI